MWRRLFARAAPPPPLVLAPPTGPQHRDALIRQIVGEDDGLAEAHRRIGATVEAIPDADNRDHQRGHVVRWLKTVAMLPQGPGELLDIGAADYYADALAARGWRVAPVPILAIDYETDPLPFADGRFDAALLAEVIEHFVLDPLFALNEINRALKPGGVFVVTTPNIASWFAIHQALNQKHPARWPVYSRNPAKARNHLHAREYTVSELRLIVEAAGFEVTECVTLDYGVAPPLAAIPGFTEEHRGETIFLAARKSGPPRWRALAPIYLENEPFAAVGA